MVHVMKGRNVLLDLILLNSFLKCFCYMYVRQKTVENPPTQNLYHTQLFQTTSSEVDEFYGVTLLPTFTRVGFENKFDQPSRESVGVCGLCVLLFFCSRKVHFSSNFQLLLSLSLSESKQRNRFPSPCVCVCVCVGYLSYSRADINCRPEIICKFNVKHLQRCNACKSNPD